MEGVKPHSYQKEKTFRYLSDTIAMFHDFRRHMLRCRRKMLQLALFEVKIVMRTQTDKEISI